MLIGGRDGLNDGSEGRGGRKAKPSNVVQKRENDETMKQDIHKHVLNVNFFSECIQHHQSVF
jgi:hypothetical protein